MTERVHVLRHHADLIRNRWPGITDVVKANSVLTKDLLSELRSEKFPNGELAYPHMKEGELIMEFAKMVVAVNTDQADVLSERKADGTENFDGVCGCCGNCVESVNFPGAMMCGLSRRTWEFKT